MFRVVRYDVAIEIFIREDVFSIFSLDPRVIRMTCPMCDGPILSNEDYTVRACCAIRYHAGCIHRRYVSGPRACPKCGKGPSLPFDEAPGTIPSRIKEAGSASSTGLVKRLVDRLSFSATAPAQELTIRELLDKGWTWVDMHDAGATKDELRARGLDTELARLHATALKSVFDFKTADFATLRK